MNIVKTNILRAYIIQGELFHYYVPPTKGGGGHIVGVGTVIFDSNNQLISCPLCKSKTLWNIFMILGRNVEQDQTMCRVQE